MDFKEAIDFMYDGEAMRRAAWNLSEGYLKILPGMKHVWKIMLEPNPNAGNFIFALEDFAAEDWQKFELGNVVESEVDPVGAPPA